MSANKSWFELPFYRSLTEQILLLGAPKPALLINGLVGFLFIINFRFWYIIPLTILIHFGCIYVAKNDAQFVDCLQAYNSKKNYYCT